MRTIKTKIGKTTHIPPKSNTKVKDKGLLIIITFELYTNNR